MADLPTDDKLQRYLDGELARDEARDVERALAASPELRAKADAARQLREILVARMEFAEDEADARLDALWDKVRDGLSRAPPAAPRRRLWAGVRDWLETYRSHVLTAAVAAAAGAVLATFIGGHPPGRTVAGRAEAAEVESLEVADGSGTVLQIPGEGGEPASTVIWITPEAPGEGPI
jgi:anti-sigma factor RsiW